MEVNSNGRRPTAANDGEHAILPRHWNKRTLACGAVSAEHAEGPLINFQTRLQLNHSFSKQRCEIFRLVGNISSLLSSATIASCRCCRNKSSPTMPSVPPTGAQNWRKPPPRLHESPCRRSSAFDHWRLAEFVSITLQAGQTLWLVVSDDEWLPDLSNALDLALRPLCLVLPSPGFAAGITLRATLSLLKSRLSRGGDPACAAIWETQRGVLSSHSELWQAALDWSARSSADHTWPARIGELFPVCILTSSHAEKLDGPPRDVLLLLHPERMSGALPQLLTRGRHALLLHDAAAATDRIIPVSEETQLKAEFEMLVQELGDMELEFATVQAELAEFTRIYHASVGEHG